MDEVTLPPEPRFQTTRPVVASRFMAQLLPWLMMASTTPSEGYVLNHVMTVKGCVPVGLKVESKPALMDEMMPLIGAATPLLIPTMAGPAVPPGTMPET